MRTHHSRLARALLTSTLVAPHLAQAQTNLQHVPNNAGLAALSTATLQVVVRDGHTVAGDSPALMFTASTVACAISGGNGYTQVPSSDGKCWLSAPDVPDIRLAGASQASTNAAKAANAAALSAIVSASGRAIVPQGVFSTGLASDVIPRPVQGEGRIVDVAGNKRAPKYDTISVRPVTAVTAVIPNNPLAYDSAETAFNGDWSHAGGEEYRIYGGDTLGKPVTGYVYTPEATPHYLNYYNASGWNQSTSGNGGRTAATGYRVQGTQVGQGDLINFSSSCVVSDAGNKVGATNFLANPACSLFAGDAFAAGNGVYLNPIEINLKGNDFDVSGVGAVFNLDRDVSTANLKAYWAGVRLQSKGVVAVDTAWSAIGPFRFGLDFSGATFGADKAAITLARGQRIYGNAENDGTLSGNAEQRFPTTLGSDWITNEQGVQGWNFVVAGASQFQINATQVTALKPVAAAGFTGLIQNASASLGASTYVGAGASAACATGYRCDIFSGTYTLTTGTGSLAKGAVLTLTFGLPRGQIPNCIVSMQQGTASPLPVAKVAATSGLTFFPGSPLTPSTSYTLDYICGGS